MQGHEYLNQKELVENALLSSSVDDELWERAVEAVMVLIEPWLKKGYSFKSLDVSQSGKISAIHLNPFTLKEEMREILRAS